MTSFLVDFVSSHDGIRKRKRESMKRLWFLMTLLVLFLFPLQNPLAADPVLSARLQDSLLTLSKIMASPQTAIPPILLARAEGIAIIPGMVRASFFMGARFGKGVLMVRGKNGQWGNPVLININGGSFGLQIGLQSTDLVLVFRRSRALEMKAKRNVILGTDVSIVAGTLGLDMDETTESDLNAEIYSFSRSTGLNVGFALQGATLRLDDAATAALYGKKGLTAQDVLWGKVDTATPEVLRFRENFIKITGKTQ
jgi:lipid-binding SYLF domain-containing protein